MRIKHLDALRGMAVIMVTFFHLSGSSGLSKATASYGSYGWLGVEIFFVISGFILPYSMFKSKYDLKQFGRFILKRVIRIYPAYILTALTSIVVAHITHREAFSNTTIFLHLLFLNQILKYAWISVVFWTLAIEFQFYLLIGLLYNYISKSHFSSIITILLLTFSGFVLDKVTHGDQAYLGHWFPFFALGILIFNRKIKEMPLAMYLTTSAVLVVYIAVVIGIQECAASLFAILFILADQINTGSLVARILLWFGKISYSLYLVHWELGRAAVAVSRHLPLIGNNELARVVIGFSFAVLSAFLMYIFIEKPSMLYAGKVKYRHR